jgi:hypothetical protein
MAQGLDEGKSFYRGRPHHPRVGKGEESADAIVIGSNEPMNKSEDSQGNEGLNIKMFQIKQGSAIWS